MQAHTSVLVDVPVTTSKTTGESHVVVTDDNGNSPLLLTGLLLKHNTNAGKTSEDGGLKF